MQCQVNRAITGRSVSIVGGWGGQSAGSALPRLTFFGAFTVLCLRIPKKLVDFPE